MTCHPTHTQVIQKTKEQKAFEDDQAQERIDQDRKALRIDPRKIKRQHRWKLGHDPIDQDDHRNPDIAYLKLVPGDDPGDPDQRDELHGGPESGMVCPLPACDHKMNIVGEKTLMEIYTQPGVSVVNLDSMSPERKAEVEKTIVVVLACPMHPTQKMQLFEEALPDVW